MRHSAFMMCTAMLLSAPVASAAAPPDGEWKVLGKLKLPSPAVNMSISEDNRQIFAMCVEKRRRDSGGATPGFVQVTILRCFAADTGKELFFKNMSDLTPQMSLRAGKLAMNDTFDKVSVYDVHTWSRLTLIDTRSPNDSPPGADKGIPPELKDFGGGGRLGDIKLNADGKILVTIRMDNNGWKQNAKKTAWTAESFQRVVFWDAYKGTKLATLDCEDKEASNPSLTLLSRRNQMLVKFDNGVRLLDLATRKWGTIFPVKDVYFAAASPDEKVLAVTDHDQGVKLFSLDTGKETLSFKERPIILQPRLNGSGRFEFGPLVQFVDDGKILRVTLNDRKNVLYRDTVKGGIVKAPATETLKFPGGPAKVLAISVDRRCAVTTTTVGSLNCTVWQRAEKRKA